MKLTTAPQDAEIVRVLGAKEIVQLQDIVRRVPCADHVLRYAMNFSRWTRLRGSDAPSFIADYVSWGAGPRASQNLVMAGKARAILHGRYFVSTEDIRAVAHPVLRHRIITNFNAEADAIRSDDIIDKLIAAIPTDESARIDSAMARRVFATHPKDN